MRDALHWEKNEKTWNFPQALTIRGEILAQHRLGNQTLCSCSSSIGWKNLPFPMIAFHDAPEFHPPMGQAQKSLSLALSLPVRPRFSPLTNDSMHLLL